MNEYCIRDLAEIIGGRIRLGTMPPIGGSLEPLGEVATDIGHVRPGTVFWGLRRSEMDSVPCVEEAFCRGAQGVVVSGREIEPWAGRFCIQVDDAAEALRRLAQSVRRQFTGKVIAVAGQQGEVITARMIHTVLSSQFSGCTSQQTLFDSVDVSLEMLQWNESDDYGVIELGYKQGEVEPLSNLCCPHIGVFFQVNQDFLSSNYLGSAADAQQLLELLSSLPQDGCIVLNGDDPWLRRAVADISTRVIWCGRDSSCDIVASDVSCRGRLSFTAEGQEFRVPVWGRHHLNSALVAIAVGQLLGIEYAQIAQALSSFQVPPKHGEVILFNGKTIIDNTLNTSIRAILAAFEGLRDINCSGKKIVVCGDASVDTDDGEEMHYQLGNEVVKKCGANMLIACGQFSGELIKGARNAGMPKQQTLACKLPEEALPKLQTSFGPGDTLLVNGSTTIEMNRFVEALGYKTTAAAA